MHEGRTCFEAEVHAALCSADIDILDIRALGEVLHVRRTVKYRVDRRLHMEVARHIALYHKYPRAKQFVETAK